jgi:hypothetical protein
MQTVPRVHDSLQIRGVAAQTYELIDHLGRPRLRLDEAGRFVVLRLDGLAAFDDVAADFRARFGRALDPGGFSRAVQRLAGAGLLTTDERALRVLRALRMEGVRYRTAVRDRRAQPRGDRRRPDAEPVAVAFDHAIYLLNEGRLDRALDLFRSLARSRPADVRLRLLCVALERAGRCQMPSA